MKDWVGKNTVFIALFMQYCYPGTTRIKVATTARRYYELCENDLSCYLIVATKRKQVTMIKAGTRECMEKRLSKIIRRSEKYKQL